MALNNNHSQQLSLLNYKYLLLKAKIEATAKQIIELGGELPEKADVTPMSGLSLNVMDDKMFLEHSVWKERVVKIIESFAEPFNAKEISEILHEHYHKLCVSTIHVQVLKVIRTLSAEGFLEKKKSSNSKYVVCRHS